LKSLKLDITFLINLISLSILHILYMDKNYSFIIIFIFFTILLKKYLNYLSTIFMNLTFILISIHILTFEIIAIKAEISYSLLILMLISLLSIYNLSLNIFIKIGAFILSQFLIIITFITPLFYLLYYIRFGVPLDVSAILAIYQTNINEALEFLEVNYGEFWWIYILLSFIFIEYIYLKLLNDSYLSQRVSISIVIISIVILYKSYPYMKFFSFITDTNKKYTYEINRFKSMQQQISLEEFNVSKKEEGETYIIVIGESLNKHHMSLYDYARDTTPNLRKLFEDKKIIRFNQAYPAFVNTVPALKLALTQASQENNLSYYNAIDIVTLLNRAGFDTYWLTNQSLYGAWDTSTSIIAHNAKYLYSYNSFIGKEVRSIHYDEVILRDLKSILEQKSSKNRVIFIHLMGNHVRYSSRYPKKFDKFKEYSEIIFGKVAHQSLLLTLKDLYHKRVSLHTFIDKLLQKDIKRINSYDNSVYYNDFILSKIIKLFNDNVDIGSLIYFSDHSEDVVEGNSHYYGNFKWTMTQIPLIIYPTNRYRLKYPDKIQNMINNRNKLFCNEYIFDTIVGICNIKSDIINKNRDLTNKNYSLLPSKAYLFNKKLLYSDATNYFYWQHKNAYRLKSINLPYTIAVHRVDGIQKLKQVIYDGYRDIEVDVNYISNKNIIAVGHDIYNNYISFEEFIKRYINKIDFIWIDFKNINKDNIDKVISIFKKLDNRYNLKDRVIIESHSAYAINRLKEYGWRNSLYLPVFNIKNALKDHNKDRLYNLAQNIIKEIKSYKIDAISFESVIYQSFVKEYIEPFVSKELKFYIWWGIDLKDKDFFKKQKAQFIDDRFQVILCRYHTLYEF